MKLLLHSLAILLLFAPLHAQTSPRVTTSLNGEWTFHREGSKETKTVTLPTHWETHEGLKFDGIGWYEKTIELPELKSGRRLLLHFDAVATHATVYWNDKKLGEHLGAWTPFRFDVTEHLSPSPSRGEGLGVRGSDSKRKHTIKVRVDEKVGHNTQGFLPIIAPHFGGIWQGVRLIEVPETYLDDLTMQVRFDPEMKHCEFKATVLGSPITLSETLTDIGPARIYSHERFDHSDTLSKNIDKVTLEEKTKEIERVKALTEKHMSEGSANSVAMKMQFKKPVQFQVGSEYKNGMSLAKQWTPQSPFMQDVTIRFGKDEVKFRVSHRTITTRGDQFLLNDQPLSIRGVLNWGYYPPSLAPTPTEEQWRADLKLIKSWGFNLMKCCLWVPPKRLLEIADEEGVLIWLEYPTWHPKLTPQYQAELMQEYKEFHELDRNHPSVILRSLTCETGPGADINVIQALYDQCKKMSGGLVVDDSSWIEWNRVFDFYDDHPYGNNHTWVATLDRLKKHIATSKYGVKPLCLGEAIAADTWVPTRPMLEAIAKAKADPKQAWSLDERGYPFWVPGFFDANRKWLERMRKVCGGAVDEEKLAEHSYNYAFLMRKYQVETYRKEVPQGGYVMSVLRDFPLASMGLIDYLGNQKGYSSKHETPEIRIRAHEADWGWHRDSWLLPLTQSNRRSFAAGREFQAEWLAYRSSSAGTGKVRWLKPLLIVGSPSNLQPPEFEAIDWSVSKRITLPNPRQQLPANLTHPEPLLSMSSLTVTMPKQMIGDVFQGWVVPKEGNLAKPESIVVLSILTEEILKKIESGGSVLFVPNNKTNSLPLRSHWFLRGAPFLNQHHPLFKSIPNLDDLLVQIQHFDLASDVIPDINYLEEIDPILMLWDNHDIKEVKTHGLVFETRVGKGRLLVSALNHQGDTNAAGKWLLHAFQKHLDSGPPPRNALKPETIARMRAKLNEKKLDLVTKPWQFMPDGKNEGLKLGWEKPGFDDQAWKPIKIGQHWEGQGYNALDGWAWYRLTVDIPKDWKKVPIFWNTEGVDDAYELYVNGTRIGSGGDIPNKKTAFEDRTAHAIPADLLKPGEKNVIAVRVYDWYGAGGIHRPMSLSNVPIGGVDILK